MTPHEARLQFFFRQGLSLLPTKQEAMQAMVAVQTQYAQSLNHALAARSSNPEPDFERRGLVPDGNLVKSWTLRNTVHTHTREEFRIVLSAIGRQRYQRNRAGMIRWLGVTDEWFDKLERETLEALTEGPLTRKELHERVPSLRSIPWAGWGADVKGLAYLGKLSFIGVGSEQRFALRHGFEPVEGAMEELARRYFASYGPATSKDFRLWVGCSAVEAKKTFDAVRHELQRVEVEGCVEPRYLLGDMDVPEPRAAVLLAKFDPVAMGWFDRSFLFPAECLKRVYRIAGQVEAVFLLRGEAAGTWRLSRSAKGIVVTMEPWRRLLKYETKALEREAHRLAQSLGVGEAVLQTQAA